MGVPFGLGIPEPAHPLDGCRSYHRQVDPGHPWDEPYSGKPRVRICEGESWMAERLDDPHF
jgi:hypothetical protein